MSTIVTVFLHIVADHNLKSVIAGAIVVQRKEEESVGVMHFEILGVLPTTGLET
jgi:hypothetical protein